MQTIDVFIRFIGTYPLWAKIAMLLGVAFVVGVGVFAPRSSIDAAAAPSGVIFRIQGLDVISADKGTAVRITAFVNGRSYIYPSLAAVSWAEVGPTMSSQAFAIPEANRYEIRFEFDLLERL